MIDPEPGHLLPGSWSQHCQRRANAGSGTDSWSGRGVSCGVVINTFVIMLVVRSWSVSASCSRTWLPVGRAAVAGRQISAYPCPDPQSGGCPDRK